MSVENKNKKEEILLDIIELLNNSTINDSYIFVNKSNIDKVKLENLITIIKHYSKSSNDLLNKMHSHYNNSKEGIINIKSNKKSKEEIEKINLMELSIKKILIFLLGGRIIDGNNKNISYKINLSNYILGETPDIDKGEKLYDIKRMFKELIKIIKK